MSTAKISLFIYLAGYLVIIIIIVIVIVIVIL